VDRCTQLRRLAVGPVRAPEGGGGSNLRQIAATVADI
jgi:hypothetical protein